MNEQKQTDRIQTGEFSIAFQQMCNFVAVAQFGKPAETVKGLIQLCFILLDDKYESHLDLAKSIDGLFGIRIPDLQMETAVNQLLSQGILRCPAGTNLTLNPDTRTALNERIEERRKLEVNTRNKWLNEIETEFPSLDQSNAWQALQTYLRGAFRRHGIQAVAFFDPEIQIPSDAEQSLSTLLRNAASGHFDKAQHDDAERALSGFMAKVGDDPERAQYIAQLADGAFNFYSLEVDPEVAAEFRKNLNPLTLFLDTNFLFGILNLHSNSQVGISQELMRVIQKHKLPFKLRFHQRTQEEFRHAIRAHADRLRSRQWPRSLSRAAAESRNLTGIEQRFHERNAAQGIDVQEFLRPFEHVDELLKEKDIKIFRVTGNRTEEKVELHHDYIDFLKANDKPEKPYDTIAHDMTVLDAVRQQRKDSHSTLDAGALLITCDYWLFRFDTDSSRRSGLPKSVLLPNVFWQILRPYIPADHDFDKAFAETFALPEFRAIGSDSSIACSKMLEILASYKNLPEETAAKMLSNGILLDKLSTTKNDKDFGELVEAAFVEDNATLLEEKAALEDELEAAKREKHEQAQKLQSQMDEQSEKFQAEIQSAELGRQEEQVRAKNAETEAVLARKSEIAAKARVKQEEEARQKAELHAKRLSVIAALSVAALLIGGFEFIVYAIPWVWLTAHSNSYGLQFGIDLTIFSAVMCIFYPAHRNWWIGTFLVAVVLGLMGILGGPSRSDNESSGYRSKVLHPVAFHSSETE